VTAIVDPVARARADEAHTKIEAHEDLCAERYSNIHDKLGMIMRVMGWGGATLATVIIAVMGFLAVRLIDASATRVQMLEQQMQVAPKTGSPR
jgi:hypothetical protein